MDAKVVKRRLLALVDDLARISWLFSVNPTSDFTRHRKLGFATVIRILLSMQSGCLRSELQEFFRFSADCPSASAFVQQRNKLLPEALAFLFRTFNEAFPCRKTYSGYHLLACDGSDLNIAHNPSDVDTYFQYSSANRGFNQLHLNALFDLCEKRYVDAIVQPALRENETLAMIRMAERYSGPKKTILIADRGYESYNLFAHIQEKGLFYLIRVRDADQHGMTTGFRLPKSKAFDLSLHFLLTRKQTNEVKSQPERFKILARTTSFDFLDDREFYPMNFRVVRFEISKDVYECVITNLPRRDFPPSEIKKLYNMRWGIETSFRELKYAVGLNCFHAKKSALVLQEIFARLILYNYSSIITLGIGIPRKHTQCTQRTQRTQRTQHTQHPYQFNSTNAIQLCRQHLRGGISALNLVAQIQKHLLPIRPGRSAHRKVNPMSMVTFLYRPA